MTPEDDDRVGLGSVKSTTDAVYQPHQSHDTLSINATMLAHGYLNSSLPSYDVGSYGAQTYNHPEQSTESSMSHYSPFEYSVQTGHTFFPQSLPNDPSISQNCLSRALIQHPQETESRATFNYQPYSPYPQLQMATMNSSSHVPTYPHPMQSDGMTQYLPFTRNNEPIYNSAQWSEPPPRAETPWLEPSSLCYSQEQCDDEAEDEFYDKPYAQLIYECLMQAPGHRMLLRDIYEWFIKHTRKPNDSGTNGWQNSIRHNLSMNQGFENDKNDPAAKGGARKANSVWVLTKHAITHGVQSTTRYRKNATARRGSSKRAPAVQRQRSGARGGRATRRAARVKTTGSTEQPSILERLQLEVSTNPSYFLSPQLNSQGSHSTCGYSPSTPSGDQLFSSSYTLPHRPYYDYGQQMLPKVEEEEQIFVEDDEELRQMLCQSSMNDLL